LAQLLTRDNLPIDRDGPVSNFDHPDAELPIARNQADTATQPDDFEPVLDR
jgi:hypothetical protein